MINSPKVKGVIGLFTLGILFGIYSLGQAFFSKPSRDHYAYIPIQAHYLIEVHTEDMLSQTVKDLLVSSEDSSLFRLLQDKMAETEWSNLGNQGIDPRADVLLFVADVKGHSLFGQLMHLKDVEAFRKNYMAEIDASLRCAVIRQHTALILWQNDTHFSPDELQGIAKKFMDGKHRQLVEDDGDGFIHLHSFAQGKARQSTIHCRTSDHALHFEGAMEYIPDALAPLKLRALEADGFHYTTRFVPAFVADLDGFELPIPMRGLSAFSLNYRGVHVNTEKSPQILPDIDVLLHFEQDFAIRPFLDSLAADHVIRLLENGSFQCGGAAFYYRQIEGNQVYIGRQPMGELHALEPQEAFRMSGSVSDLARMKTEGWIGRFIEMLPAFAASQEFSANCDRLELEGKTQGRQIKIEGRLDFKANHHFTTEVLRFLLRGNFM